MELGESELHELMSLRVFTSDPRQIRSSLICPKFVSGYVGVTFCFSERVLEASGIRSVSFELTVDIKSLRRTWGRGNTSLGLCENGGESWWQLRGWGGRGGSDAA
ncbi:hypothetical protein PIB30_045303 [Stylosanthes scabra]|uniref:Uncharacterized protein n=1 Tax=Stylosanthes scabra TaxID=79078 RepID=A0ABU6VF36_9FABA|nr:hypothetical protein [Stylosanthes scabra]